MYENISLEGEKSFVLSTANVFSRKKKQARESWLDQDKRKREKNPEGWHDELGQLAVAKKAPLPQKVGRSPPLRQ